ncbi:WD40 repeat-like protein [Thelephora ganbajun]|uniref:WD40 repeat-like protein n=1 Tax=Thelephora ganbajun TaxID=370292 RepID=A0ACB6ZVV3_THEGA|nr:WD40 repeat-like protein [Thelephora ganbajun]
MLSVPPLQHPLPTIPSVTDLRLDGPTPPDPQGGPFKSARFPRATANGGGTIAKSEDGERCAVSGRESLRILKVVAVEEGDTRKGIPPGPRIEASRNFWEGSGLKIDSSSTDVVWGHGIWMADLEVVFSNKILTSARNGEIITWDLNKNSTAKYERRARDHTRAIHRLSYSTIVHHYCLSGSADGDVRIWDLRDMSKSVLKIHHPTGVRALAFSSSQPQPLHTIVGLDNGCLYRWDLRMGQRGQLDRIPVAHAGPILSLDWYNPQPEIEGLPSVSSQMWVATGGLDRCVKVWDFNSSTGGDGPQSPIYNLHTSFPIRRILWRPGYGCELAVVSNADFGLGFGSEISAAASKMPSPRIAEKPMQGEPQPLSILTELQNHLSPKAPFESIVSQTRNGVGDSVEIWDVRRQYIAKWLLSNSAVEGGVTDIAFKDSQTLWAQHSSGTFSQFDVRDVRAPLDAVPRVAATWEVTGSLTFVADKPSATELPYDDYPSNSQIGTLNGSEPVLSLKRLGDPVYTPGCQNIGCFVYESGFEGLETFEKLARGYKVDGGNRAEICRFNASIAYDAEQPEVAEIWLLVKSLLADLVPEPELEPDFHSHLHVQPPLSPLTGMHPGLPHSLSAPAAIHGLHRNQSPGPDLKATTSEVVLHPHRNNAYPSPRHRTHAVLTAANTPSSSSPSSPQHPSPSLPPINLIGTPIPASVFARRASATGLVSGMAGSYITRPRANSSYRRPSMSAKSTGGAPGTSYRSPALKHVGDGALSDSDSSGNEEDHEDEPGGEDEPESTPDPANDEGPEGDVFRRPHLSPYLFPRNHASHRSPLSKLVKQDRRSDEEEEDHASSSPASSNSDLGSPPSPRKRVLSALTAGVSFYSTNAMRMSVDRKRSNTVNNRSSTVASLAAGSITSSNKTISKQESHSSIRTVVAASENATPTREVPDPYSSYSQGGVGLKLSETPRKVSNGESKNGTTGRPFGHQKQLSEAAMSELVLDDHDDSRSQSQSQRGGPGSGKHIPRQGGGVMTRKREDVEEAERRFRDSGWDVVKEALEVYAEEGEIQMCAMLAVIVPKELGIAQWRATFFLESYLELMARLQLHVPAANIRKHIELEEIKSSALPATTIYTQCGRCRKAIIVPNGQRRFDQPSGGFGYCLKCRTNIARCAICRLPVRALMFHCPVCMHGGHQRCYKEYYSARTVEPLPTPAPPRTPTRPRASSTSVVGSEDDPTPPGSEIRDVSVGGVPQPLSLREQLSGHPCAAGCGHYCWASVQGGQIV